MRLLEWVWIVVSGLGSLIGTNFAWRLHKARRRTLWGAMVAWALVAVFAGLTAVLLGFRDSTAAWVPLALAVVMLTVAALLTAARGGEAWSVIWKTDR